MYFYNLARRKPEKNKEGHFASCEEGARAGVRRRETFFTPLQSVDQRALSDTGCDLFFGPPCGQGFGGYDEIASFTEKGCDCNQAMNWSGYHRHRDWAEVKASGRNGVNG